LRFVLVGGEGAVETLLAYGPV